jgi:hemerythrin
VDPESVPELPVEKMNTTHREEVELVNRIADCLGDGAAPCMELETLLAEWVAHTEAHFERENRWMREYGFPAYPVHAGEHARVLETLRRVCGQWRETGEAAGLARFVHEDWPQWFEQHLATMDAVTAQFLARVAGPDLT